MIRCHTVCMAVFFTLGLVFFFEGYSIQTKSGVSSKDQGHSVILGSFQTRNGAEQERVNAIPRIIHQTWKTKAVPAVTASWIKSWMKYHPEWEYWFWTDEDAKTLIATRYPGFLALYNSYLLNIHRADLMRYFIMYEFGGVYADLDVEALQPLDSQLQNQSCIVSQEPKLHAYLMVDRADTSMGNAVLACIPKHPFFRLVIEALSSYSKSKGVYKTTGPFMLDDVLSFFEELDFSRIPKNVVQRAPPDLFMPKYSGVYKPIAMKKCANIIQNTKENNLLMLRNKLVRRQRKLCRRLAATNFANDILPTSYTVHHWMHTWYRIKHEYNTSKEISIESILPNAVLSNSFLTRKTKTYEDRPLMPDDKSSSLNRLLDASV